MSALFIAGNGFDLAHGIPSKYSEFRNFILESFPEISPVRDHIVLPHEIINMDPFSFSAELLLCAMDQASGENWCDFEEGLSRISFNKKFPFPNHKENETDEEDNELMHKYLSHIAFLLNYCIYRSNDWRNLFSDWIKIIQKGIEQKFYLPRENLQQLFSDPDMQFFTFNYTKTLQIVYGAKKVIHIHNRVGQKLIFGHSGYIPWKAPHYSEGPDLHSTDFDKVIHSFKKDTDVALKKYKDFFKRLNHDIDKVYSYGFSYGDVDSIYIKAIISKISLSATWYFTKYEASDKEALHIKKIKLRNYGFKGNFDIFDA